MCVCVCVYMHVSEAEAEAEHFSHSEGIILAEPGCLGCSEGN